MIDNIYNLIRINYKSGNTNLAVVRGELKQYNDFSNLVTDIDEIPEEFKTKLGSYICSLVDKSSIESISLYIE